MKKKPLIIYYNPLSIAAALAFCFSAQAAPQPHNAPLNPEFVKYRMALKEWKAAGKSEDGHPLGDIPAPFELSNVQPSKTAGKKYPASYDLRTVNKMTPVRDQGAYGTCWTFGSMGSMESNLMPLLPNPDLSENNVADYAGFNPNFNGGGSTYMSTAYLARWAGAFSEEQDPYPNPGYLPPMDTQLKYHMQNIIFVPARTSPTANDIIKEILTTHGACSISFYYSPEYYSSANFAFYNNVNTSSNHAVTLAGWNDDYPAQNFSIPPPGNGAFLIKNSWGTAWGDQGYFWLSYHDTSIKRITCFYGAEPIDNYTGICQYDTLGWVNGFGDGAETFWGANIFTAGSSDPIQAVSTYAVSSNCAYEIRVYTGVTAGNPTSGTLATTLNGTIALPGYYTIPFDNVVPVAEGQLFSVAVKYTTPGYGWPAPYECAVEDYSTAAVALPGQSFYSADGTAWTDFTASDPTANACIKAFGPTSASGETGAAFHATIGSEFHVSCPTGQFEAKPGCYITGGSLESKKKSLKILKGDGYPASAVKCQWTNKLAASSFQLCVKRKVKGEKPAPEIISNAFFVEVPEITKASSSVVSGLREIILAGLNFGTKKPRLYLRYTLDKKEKKLNCKVTEYDLDGIQGSVKESTLQKLRDKGVSEFFIVVENAIGKDDSGYSIK